jgi:hypothetical protein
MDRIKNFLDSTPGKIGITIFSLALSIIGFILRIVSALLPDYLVVFAQVALYLISAYLLIVVVILIYILVKMGISKYRNSLAKELAKQINSELYESQRSSETILDDEVNYEYQANRYGVGYQDFDVHCIIDEDGSATVVRDVQVEAFSTVGELDTFIRIKEEDPFGQSRNIKKGKITTRSDRNLKLIVIEEKPGMLLADIKIAPSLKKGEKLQYAIEEHLPKGLFAINLDEDELSKRETKYDYFGWHINRPTKSFALKVEFPPNIIPIDYDAEVKYAASAGNPSNRVQYEEQNNLKPIIVEHNANRSILRLEVNYPLYGLVYILRWEPVPRG